jgi:hypothetical protein
MPTVPSSKQFYIGTKVLSGTSGSILFVDSNTKVAQDNANLTFDDATNSLTVGGNVTGGAFYGDGSNLTNLPASTWYDGVEIPAAGFGDENDYYLQNTSGDYYNKQSGVWTLVGNLRPPANSYQGNYLISGGQIVWVSSYIFSVSPAVYSLGGQIYSSPLTLVTLDAADLTYDRIDLIVLDDTGAADFVTGTASASPVEPDIDPASQLKLSFLIVGAGTTEPGVALTAIYQEDIEWTTTVSHATLNKISANNPRSGSKCIEGTNVLKTQYFQSVSPSSFDINSKDLFVFYVRSKAGWGGGAINIQWRLGTTNRGVTISLVDGFAGFDSTNTSTYQQIAIPTSAFNIAQGLLVDRVRFTISKATGSIGFYFDDCWLQAGIVPSPGTTPGGIVWRGEWSASTAYSEQDAVSYNGTSYIAIASSVNLAPDTNTDEWNILAQGVDGSGIAYLANNQTFTNTNTFSKNGAASTSAVELTGTIFTGGTGTTTYPLLRINDSGAAAMTAWSTSGTYIGVNAKNAFIGKLLDLAVDATSVFHVNAYGQVTCGTVSSNGNLIATGSLTVAGTADTGRFTCSGAGGIVQSAARFNGALVSGQLAEYSYPHVFIQPTGTTDATTWSTGGTAFGANTASGFTGNFLDFHVNGGVSVFNVGYTGAITALSYSGSLVSSVTATTQSPGDSSTKVATTEFVTLAITAGLLTVDLSNYAPLESPALTGNPTAPTPAANDNDTSIATTAYVQTELANVAIGTFGCNFNGNGTTPAIGSKFRLEIPYACTINSVTLLGDLTGDAVVDIWVDTYANYSPTVADSICGSNKPTISSSNKGQLTSFSTWTTTSIAAGSIAVINLDSVSTITDLTIIVKVTKT